MEGFPDLTKTQTPFVFGTAFESLELTTQFEDARQQTNDRFREGTKEFRAGKELDAYVDACTISFGKHIVDEQLWCSM